MFDLYAENSVFFGILIFTILYIVYKDHILIRFVAKYRDTLYKKNIYIYISS